MLENFENKFIRKIDIRIKKFGLFLILIAMINIPIVIFVIFLYKGTISISTLFTIWTIELAITTISLTIMTTILSNINKKLYGIQLSKIIVVSNHFMPILISLFLFNIFTVIPVIVHKIAVYIVLFYLLSSSFASWFVIEAMYALSFPEDWEELVKEFYKNKIVSKKDFIMLIEENLCPYIYELIEKRNFGEYNKNFEFLIELFSIIRENGYEEKSKLLNFMEDKLYEVLKFTEMCLPSLFDLNIKILKDENYQKLSRLNFSNIEKRRAILNLAGKLSMKIIVIS